MINKLTIALIALIVFINFCLCQSKHKQIIYDPICKITGQQIWDIVNVPEKNIDIGLWPLIVAKEFDNTININLYMSKLDSISNEINKMLAGRKSDMDIFLAVKMFQFENGVWINNKSFKYDLQDPFGYNLNNKLLSTYIDTHLGNCVSMPTLFLSLMERIDHNFHFRGVMAPLHLFCRQRNRQTGDVWNIETTNGGNPVRNQWYIEQLNINQKSIDSGLYLSDLTKKEYIAELISILVSKYRKLEEYDMAMEYANLILRINPNSDTGLVQKCALSSWIAYNIELKAKNENRAMTKSEL